MDQPKVDHKVQVYVDYPLHQTISWLRQSLGLKSNSATIRWLIDRALENLDGQEIRYEMVAMQTIAQMKDLIRTYDDQVLKIIQGE